MPIASTRPKSVKLFSEKPAAAMTAKVPMMATGTAISGMSAERQFCKKSSTTSATSTMASRRVLTTSLALAPWICIGETSGSVIRAFQNHKVPLNIHVEMPTVEAIRKMVERGQGVAFLPRMCVEHEIRHGLLREVKVKELELERQIRLVYPARRALSHAAQAFLELVQA